MSGARTIRLLLAYVDGTLLTKDKVLTEAAKEAAQELHDAGIAFAITSGRPPRGMSMLVEPLHLTTPIAAFNGGVFVRPDLTIVDQRTIPESLVPEAIDVMRRGGLDVWLYRGADWYIQHKDAPHVDREAWTVKFAPKVVDSYDGLTKDVAKLVGVSDDREVMQRCTADMQARFGKRVTAETSQPYYLDVTHPEANKGAVAQRLSDLLHVPLDRMATIGDQMNDTLMFRESGLSIAMGNASADVQRQATFVTTSFGEEGFANAVERYILPRAQLSKAT